MRAVSPVMYSSKHTCISHGSMDGIAASTGMRCTYHITRAIVERKAAATTCHAICRVPCGICHQCSLGELRATPGRCALAHCATLRAECGCAERHQQRVRGCTDPRRRPPARANRAKKQRQPGTLPRSSHRCATSAAASSAAVATAGRSPCRDRRRRGRRLAPTPHVAPWLHEPREQWRLRARQAAVAEGGSDRSCAVPWRAVSWQCRFLRRCPRA